MLTPDPQLFATSPHSRGFGLVELMVAMVITLILLAGVAQIFLGSKKSYVIQDSLARQQETGRYAFDVLATDLRRAGYWGSSLAISEGAIAAGTDCPTDNSNWAKMADHRVFGLNDAKTGYDCIPDYGSTNGYFNQGDVLVVRYAGPKIIGGSDNTAFDNTRLYLRSNDPDSALVDAYKGQIDTGNNLGTPIADAPASEWLAYAYFIGDSGQTCNGTKVPSLFRVSLDNQGWPTTGTDIEEVAYGVDQLQVRYGLDGDGDNSVDEYVDASDIDDSDISMPDWNQVIAARFWLLTRAECPETGYTNTNTYDIGDLAYSPADGYRRQLYQTTVTLRNR